MKVTVKNKEANSILSQIGSSAEKIKTTDANGVTIEKQYGLLHEGLWANEKGKLSLIKSHMLPGLQALGEALQGLFAKYGRERVKDGPSGSIILAPPADFNEEKREAFDAEVKEFTQELNELLDGSFEVEINPVDWNKIKDKFLCFSYDFDMLKPFFENFD